MSPAEPIEASTGAVTEARQLFADYAKKARRATLLALPSGESQEYLYNLLPSYFLPSSAKYLRPVLCLAACGAHGRRISDAMAAAVGLELLHNAFLIHDDIQDESTHRRGQPSLWRQHGTALATNAGDALAAHASRHVAEKCRSLGWPMANAVHDEFHRALVETTEGQSLELGWRRDVPAGLGVGDYVRMAVKKTAWYSTIAPIRIGALIGSYGRVEPDRYNRFGSYLGGMFQIKNDLASIDPRFGGDGHLPCDDLYEGKATLSLIHLMGAAADGSGCEAEEWVRGFLKKKRSERTADEADRIREHMKERGSVDFAVECFQEMAHAADREAQLAFRHLPDTADRRLLMAMATIMQDDLDAEVRAF